MHDLIGSAGMLRGWVALWTMQMMWLIATMTVSVGAITMAELLITRHARYVQGRMPAQVSAVVISLRERPTL